jgi:hypothetical protein
LLEASMVPNFVIIGAQKCGTTFLYRRLLSQHPHVEPARKKEIHYFDLWKHYSRGGDWYRSHFPLPTRKAGRRSITGEASPYYLFHPHAARRMAEIVPRVRLIVLLRNPVDRAYSSYQHAVRKGTETLSTFEEAIELEEARLRGEKDKMLADERYDSLNYRRFSYLSRGVYVDQLMEWSRFFSSDQMLVLKSEDFFERPPDVLKLVLNFLGLPDWEPEAWGSRKKRKYPPMNLATRQRLRSYFEPYNQRLYEYLGVDFGW